MILVLLIVTSMPAVKQVQEWTKEQQNVRQGAENMCFVLFPKEKERDRGKSEKHKASS
jgi:hypothetical protein